MRIDRLAARVLAALTRDDHDGPARVPLLAALSRDTPAFGGATAVSTPGTGPRWTFPAALLRRAAPPAEHQPAPPEQRERPAARPGHVDGPPRKTTGGTARNGDDDPLWRGNPDGALRRGDDDTRRHGNDNDDARRHGSGNDNDNDARRHDNDARRHDNDARRHDNDARRHDNDARRHDNDARRHGDDAQRHGDGVQRPAADNGPPRQARREPGPPPLFSMPDPTPARRMPSTTTRRLCAAVHLDADLARRVVAELTGDPRRAVPPSVGFDLEPVLCHALRARLLATARDGFLTATVLAALVLAPRTTAAVLLPAPPPGWAGPRRCGRCRRPAGRCSPPRSSSAS
ncbi:hypothetical protein [Dactylosporangium cerinum]